MESHSLCWIYLHATLLSQFWVLSVFCSHLGYNICMQHATTWLFIPHPCTHDLNINQVSDQQSWGHNWIIHIQPLWHCILLCFLFKSVCVLCSMLAAIQISPWVQWRWKLKDWVQFGLWLITSNGKKRNTTIQLSFTLPVSVSFVLFQHVGHLYIIFNTLSCGRKWPESCVHTQ